MFSLTALFISLTILFSIPTVLGWNSASKATTGLEFDSIDFPLAKRQTGWQAGPSQRGTLTIIWSCLSTVIACTWTILHLNVPRRCDNTWEKTYRKAKWMVITILFPEFIFSKALCELQMAVDDLYAMKEKERDGVLEWNVRFGPGVQFLHKLFNPSKYFGRTTALGRISSANKHTGTSREKAVTTGVQRDWAAKTLTYPSTYSHDPDILPNEKRVWTLTHSYFANMGGFARYRNPNPNFNSIIPVTANALVNCCVGSDHDPLPTLAIEKKDIDDKAKADWFVKSIAVTQISWLLLSVIVRAVRKLPISQLEICTSAFAILAIATYFANWSKPKDVGTPVRFRVLADTYQCEAQKYHGEPFFRRQIKPSGTVGAVVGCRIENDFVRLEGWLPPMAIAMAISTAVFGGLHCLAWNFEFPTEAELGIWMVASVLSATIPTFALLVNIVFVSGIHGEIRTCQKHFQQKLQMLDGTAQEPSHIPIEFSNTCARPPAWLGSNHPELAKKLSTFHCDLGNFMNLGIHHLKLFASYDDALEACGGYQKTEVRGELQKMGLEPHEVKFLFCLFENPEFVRGEKERLDSIISPRDLASRLITIVGGLLYAVVRLMLLTLTFCALRSVPEGVYIVTWTKFLPNIS